MAVFTCAKCKKSSEEEFNGQVLCLACVDVMYAELEDDEEEYEEDDEDEDDEY